MANSDKPNGRAQVEDSRGAQYFISSGYLDALKAAKTPVGRDTMIHHAGTAVRLPEPINPARRGGIHPAAEGLVNGEKRHRPRHYSKDK